MIAEKKILIAAPAKKVWDVLIKPRFIRKWSELPRGFGNSALEFETVIRWPGDDDQFIERTVTALEPLSFLRLAYFDSSWENLPVEPITYSFKLEAAGAKTRLIMQVGDFRQLENGEREYKTAIDFVKQATQKIKETAESSI